MSINVEDILIPMVNAAKDSFEKNWPEIKDFAIPELNKIAIEIVSIEFLVKSGRVTEGAASVLLDMQINASRAILLALKGMSLLMVEQAINASLKAIEDIVNQAFGFTLFA